MLKIYSNISPKFEKKNIEHNYMKLEQFLEEANETFDRLS